MGCTICRKKEEPDVEINKADQNGYKDLFYATNEFDLSRSESEDEEEEEEENYVLNSIQNTQQQLIEKVISPSNELNSTSNTSSTIINDEIVQTNVS